MKTADNSPNEFSAYETIEGDLSKGLILLCDHAASFLPEKYGSLGLDAAQFNRHIAYDIGARALTCALAARLKVPAVMSTFSRLLIDPNRGLDDPTLVMKLSDGTIIEGNHPISESEVNERICRYHQPYHRAIAAMIERALQSDVVPMIFSIHSFTHMWKDVPRQWHAAILWDNDSRLPNKLLEELSKQTDVIIGNNEPYDGAMGNDTMFTHCTRRGLAHALLEVRQDLIGNEAGVEEWVDRIYKALTPVMTLPQMHEINYRGSRTGPVDFV